MKRNNFLCIEFKLIKISLYVFIFHSFTLRRDKNIRLVKRRVEKSQQHSITHSFREERYALILQFGERLNEEKFCVFHSTEKSNKFYLILFFRKFLTEEEEKDMQHYK